MATLLARPTLPSFIMSSHGTRRNHGSTSCAWLVALVSHSPPLPEALLLPWWCTAGFDRALRNLEPAFLFPPPPSPGGRAPPASEVPRGPGPCDSAMLWKNSEKQCNAPCCPLAGRDGELGPCRGVGGLSNPDAQTLAWQCFYVMSSELKEADLAPPISQIGMPLSSTFGSPVGGFLSGVYNKCCSN